MDGRLTTSGAPLLAGDPHLGFGLPGFWFLARIDTPEGTLAGATAPGVPFLVLGHNSRIAWTFTTTGADTEDLFVETPAGGDAYATPDGPRPFMVREERIQVRGGPDEVLRVRETRHGPVISDLVGRPDLVLALAAANLAPGDAAPGLLALNRAGSVAEAGRAAALIAQPVQNLLVADRDGIGLFVTGRVPLRRAGDGSRPVPGADGTHDWVGFASGEALPHLAPASGRLVNANERVAPPDFRSSLAATPSTTPGPGASANCSTGPVGSRRPTSPPCRWTRSTRWRATCCRRCGRSPHRPDCPPGPGAAGGWDGRTDAGLPQPLIFNAWMRRFYRDLLARAGLPAGTEAAAAPWTTLVPTALGPAGGVLCGGDCAALLPGALAKAVDELAGRFGPDPAAWRWGEAHPAVFANPLLRAVPLLGWLSRPPSPCPATTSTLFRAGMAWGSFTAVHGAEFRGVYDLADLDRSLFVVAPGQSGHLASPRARNFVQRWRDGAMITISARPASVAVRLTLIPGASP